MPWERQHSSERQSETESEVGRQSAKQPAMRSSIQTARQTTCPVTVHPPGERGQRPSPVSVYFTETLPKRNNNRTRASGGLCFWLSKQTVQCCDRGPCCLPEDLSFTKAKNILVAFSVSQKSSDSQTGSWIWSISHVLNSVYPRAYKNTGVISP